MTLYNRSDILEGVGLIHETILILVDAGVPLQATLSDAREAMAHHLDEVEERDRGRTAQEPNR